MERRIDDSEALGEVIRQRRHELELTQEQLAGVARTSHRFVSELERGKETARLTGVLRVLDALGLRLVARNR